MAIPEFIVKLRSKIGSDPLWLSGITAYVEDEAGRVLLGQRADTGQWALVYGIIEPGEQPALAAVREVKEETGVDAVAKYLVEVKSSDRLVVYANGDQTRYLDIMFLCAPVEGGNAEPFVGDDESLAVAWFEPDALPSPLASSTIERLTTVARFKEQLASGNAAAFFVGSEPR